MDGAQWVYWRGELGGEYGFAASHPFHDETVEWMGHSGFIGGVSWGALEDPEAAEEEEDGDDGHGHVGQVVRF